MQNNCTKAESYQKLIRRDERIRKTVGITGFFEFFELLPLAYEFFPTPTFRPVLGEFQGALARNFFVFLCVLCILNAVGTVLVSKFGINFLGNPLWKNGFIPLE